MYLSGFQIGTDMNIYKQWLCAMLRDVVLEASASARGGLEAVFRLDALALSVIATATWLAGWLAVTLRYCIKTAKPIGKIFRPSESPITLAF